MPRQLLIYDFCGSALRRAASPVFGEVGGSYEFSGKVNSVPLMAVEFPQAASEYAIVFAGNDESLMPAVILGIRDTENLFVGKESAWDAKISRRS